MTAELQPSSETGIFRRLAASGAVLGSVAMLAACGANHTQNTTTHELGAPKTPAPHNLPPRGSLGNPYHNGDVIMVTPGLTARVIDDGSKVLFSRTALDHFRIAHPNAELTIDMHNQQGNDQIISVKDNQNIEMPNPFVEKQFLDCNPPADEPKPCELTVERLTARNYLLHGDPKVKKSADGIYRWPFKGSPSSIFIMPNRRPV